MSSRVNLNDNTNDTFGFTIGGLDYDLKYPTMEEITPIQELVSQTNSIENSDLPDDEKEAKLAKVREEMEEAMYKMIVPVAHNTSIQDTLKKQPFPVVKKFNKMLSEQLSAE